MRKLASFAMISTMALLLSGCASCAVAIGPHDPSPLPTAPSTIPELIESLSDPDYRVRLVATGALGEMGTAAEQAVPALIVTLSDDVSDIRAASAEALGEIGPASAPAVPALIETLRSDEFAHARANAARALGKIGDTSAIPALAETLWDSESQETYPFVPINAAKAIAWLTNKPFPDSEPGSHGYALDDDGTPLLVLAAQDWWESEGQYLAWPPVNGE